MTDYECTQKVYSLFLYNTKGQLSKIIGISRPTLDARLKFHSWKKGEKTIIKGL